MASLSRSITLVCSISKKKMRSDHLKKHWFAKQKNFDFKVTTIVRGFLKNEDSKPSSNQDLESEILANDKLLDEKIELGEKISTVLTNTKTKEESLSKKHKEAFDLYQSRKFAISRNDDVKLYPLQHQLMDLIQKPTHRKVIKTRIG